MIIPNTILDELCQQVKTIADLRNRLYKVSNTQTKIKDAENSLASAYQGWLTLKGKYEAEIRDTQKLCEHYITRYHGDPSGGSDSYHECGICKYQSKQAIPRTL